MLWRKYLRPSSLRPDHIVEAFWWNCQSVFGYVGGSEPSYSQIVCQVAEKLDIEHFGVKVEDLEVEVARKVFQTVWEKMTPDQKMAMEAELRRAAQEFDKGEALAGSTSIFSALTAAQLSGFGVYLLASTALGTSNRRYRCRAAICSLHHHVKRYSCNHWPCRLDRRRAIRNLETHRRELQAADSCNSLRVGITGKTTGQFFLTA